MTWFKNLKLATKLMVAFSVVLSLTAIVGILAVTQLNTVNECGKQISENSLPSVQYTSLLRTDIAYCRIKVLSHIMAEKPEEMRRIDEQRAEVLRVLGEHLTAYQKLPRSTEEQTSFDTFNAAFDEYVVVVDQALVASREGRKQQANEFLAQSERLFASTSTTLTKLMDLNVHQAEEASTTSSNVFSSARSWIIGVVIGSVVLGIVLAFTLARVVSGPVKSLTLIAQRIAAGDVDQRIDHTSADEVGMLAVSFQELAANIKQVIGQTSELSTAAQEGRLDARGDAAKFNGAFRSLVEGTNHILSVAEKAVGASKSAYETALAPIQEATLVLESVAQRNLTIRMNGHYEGEFNRIKVAMNAALENLENVLAEVSVGTDQVTSAATQIAQGSQSLAQGASEQASSLEEISSSLEEMASMTRQNAENSNQGKLLAAEATGAAQRGNEAMGRMAEAIDKIKASSDATAKIIKTIDEIAFQTNLLALNAAVEAARAGEAGKGFAVVAEEVRNLAQRSAEAAKNTANMIEESVKNAEGGVRITEEVAKLLVEIGEGNRKVNDLVAEIAAASGEQSKGIEQVNLAVTQLDKVTQQNAANSEESASAAEELNSQAASLSQTVGQFKISSHGQVSVTPVATASKKIIAKPVKASSTAKRLVGAGSASNGNGKASRFHSLEEADFQGF